MSIANLAKGTLGAEPAMNGDSRYWITSATSFTTFRRPNFVYPYAEPTTWSFSVTTRL